MLALVSLTALCQDALLSQETKHVLLVTSLLVTHRMASRSALPTHLAGPMAVLREDYLTQGYSKSQAYTKARCELDHAYEEAHAVKARAKASAWNREHRQQINEHMRNRYRDDHGYRADLLQRQADVYHSEPYHGIRLAQMRARLLRRATAPKESLHAQPSA